MQTTEDWKKLQKQSEGIWHLPKTSLSFNEATHFECYCANQSVQTGLLSDSRPDKTKASLRKMQLLW